LTSERFIRTLRRRRPQVFDESIRIHQLYEIHQNLEEEKTTGLRRIYKNSSTLRKVHQNLEEEKTAGLRR
jgi:hypothetical protein